MRQRFDLLRSPVLLLSVGLLLLNDFVLKAGFHNWLTGKISDVAGLAAFTIFWCAIWPGHVWKVGGCIAASFVFWKSPYAAGLIEMANAVLPFAIGRTVDYSDLIALPVVWLVCANVHHLPVVEVGKIGVWLTGGLCLFAFTATSSIGYVTPTLNRVAEFPEPAVAPDAVLALQEMVDRIAAQHGLHCVEVSVPGTCASLLQGRRYSGGGALHLAVGFDVARRRLLFEVNADSRDKAVFDKARSEVAVLQAEIERELIERFPTVTLGDWPRSQSTTTVVRVALPADDGAERAFAVSGDILQRAGLTLGERSTVGVFGQSPERVTVGATTTLPGISSWTVQCRDSRTVAVSVTAQTPDYETRQRQILKDLESGLEKVFGGDKISSGQGWTPCP